MREFWTRWYSTVVNFYHERMLKSKISDIGECFNIQQVGTNASLVAASHQLSGILMAAIYQPKVLKSDVFNDFQNMHTFCQEIKWHCSMSLYHNFFLYAHQHTFSVCRVIEEGLTSLQSFPPHISCSTIMIMWNYSSNQKGEQNIFFPWVLVIRT